MAQKNPKEILLDHYGTSSEVARAAGVSRQAVFNWWQRGGIGEESAYFIAQKMGIKPGRLLLKWTPKKRKAAKKSTR